MSNLFKHTHVRACVHTHVDEWLMYRSDTWNLRLIVITNSLITLWFYLYGVLTSCFLFSFSSSRNLACAFILVIPSCRSKAQGSGLKLDFFSNIVHFITDLIYVFDQDFDCLDFGAVTSCTALALFYFETLSDIKILKQCVLKYYNVASLCGTRSHVDLNHRVSAHFHTLILKPMSYFCFKADLFWKEEEDSCLELCVFIPLHALILKSVSSQTFILSMSIHFLSAGSPFLFVNTSGRYSGQRAQLLLPPLKENDTHCVSLLFYRQGAMSTSLNIYIKGSVIPV